MPQEITCQLVTKNWKCCLLGLARSSWYYEPVATDSEGVRPLRDVTLMNLIDAQYTETPFYGSRKMVVSLRHLGYGVNRKRVQRLMRRMGIAGERLWRSVKYEDVYLKGYQTMGEAQEGLKRYFRFYNNERFHQSLDYRTPREVHLSLGLKEGCTLPPPR